MTSTDAAALVGMLMDAFPTARITEGTVGLYKRNLERWPKELATEAIEDLIRTDERWPAWARVEGRIRAIAGEHPAGGSYRPDQQEKTASLADREHLRRIERLGALPEYLYWQVATGHMSLEAAEAEQDRLESLAPAESEVPF